MTFWVAGAALALLSQRMPLKIDAGEGRRLGFDGELLQIEAHLGGDLRRHAWIGDHLREIAARHFVAAELVIEDAELELEPRRVGREDEHALERRDRGLVVADLRGERRIFESDVEIARILQHRLKQGLAARFDIGRRDAGIGGGK